MPFRDDREALLRRAESLEQELASERQGRAASEADRARLATELRAVHEALRHVRSPVPSARRARPAAMIGVGLAIVILTVAVAVVLLGRRDAEPTPAPPFSAPVVAKPQPPPPPPLPPEPLPPPVGVNGALSADDIRAVVRRERRSAAQCYERSARGNAAPVIRVTLRVTTGATGSVEAVGVDVKPTPGSDELANCLRTAVLRWRFPPSTGSTLVEIPIVFAAGN